MSDGDAESTVAFKDVIFKQPVPNPPAQKQTIGSITAGDTLADERALRPAAGMDSKISVVFTDAINDTDIVRLLETDSIPVVIADHAVLNDGPKSPVKKNPRPSTAVQMDIGFLVAIDDNVFNPCCLDIVGTDDRKDRCGPGLVAHHTV